MQATSNIAARGAADRRTPTCPRGAFTLVEVLIAALVVGVGLAAVIASLGGLARADVRAEHAVLLQRLAAQKLAEVSASGKPLSFGDSGTFADYAHSDVAWRLDVASTSFDDVDLVTVVAVRNGEQQTVRRLMYVRPGTGSSQ